MNSECVCAREEMINGWEKGSVLPFSACQAVGLRGDLFQEISAGLSSALPRKSLQTQVPQCLSPQLYPDPI